MKETWRWFGEYDAISLAEIAQTGADGIVSALHAIPYGEIWPREEIAERRRAIEQAGFEWAVVESLPVHEDVKKGSGDLAQIFANYRQSLANLAAENIRTVCYNFMPILDWTRTDLDHPVPRGGTCLRFDAAKMAAFEIHMLGRTAAEADYSKEAIKAGKAWVQNADQEERDQLLRAIVAGLPGAFTRYDIAGFEKVLDDYQGISHEDLRANLKRFLDEVVPTAMELGINLCIHPDDPPKDILGLPRIVSTEADIEWILECHPSHANGLTLCTGSLGAHQENNLAVIAKRFADRTHFAHLRNVKKYEDGSFEESAHLQGDVNLVEVIRHLVASEKRRNVTIPFRADHGHSLLTDEGRAFQPGYTLVGRLRGLSELRGILAAVEN